MTDPTAGIPQTDQPSAPAPNRARDARLVAVGVLTVLLVWFAVANLQDVTIHFWVRSTHAPLILVVIIAGLFGAGVSELAGRLNRRRKSAAPSDPPV